MARVGRYRHDDPAESGPRIGLDRSQGVCGSTIPSANSTELREALAWRWVSDQGGAHGSIAAHRPGTQGVDHDECPDRPRRATALGGWRIVVNAGADALDDVPVWVNQPGDPLKSWRFQAETGGPLLEARPLDRPRSRRPGISPRRIRSNCRGQDPSWNRQDNSVSCGDYPGQPRAPFLFFPCRAVICRAVCRHRTTGVGSLASGIGRTTSPRSVGHRRARSEGRGGSGPSRSRRALVPEPEDSSVRMVYLLRTDEPARPHDAMAHAVPPRRDNPGGRADDDCATRGCISQSIAVARPGGQGAVIEYQASRRPLDRAIAPRWLRCRSDSIAVGTVDPTRQHEYGTENQHHRSGVR